MTVTGGDAPVVLVTGAAQRIGACITRTLHAAGYNVVVHYRQSSSAAQALCAELNTLRPNSAISLMAGLNDVQAIGWLAQQAMAQWQRVDALVNNASSFFPTPVGKTTAEQWDDLLGSNARAPFLAQALAPALAAQGGAVVNIATSMQNVRWHNTRCIAWQKRPM